MSPAGETAVVATIPTTPSGLGFAPDGALLIVSLDDSKLWRFSGGDLEEVADLSSLAFHANDMAVAGQGRAYVTQFGYDLFGGATPTPCGLVVVQPDGTAAVSGDVCSFRTAWRSPAMAELGDSRTSFCASSNTSVAMLE